MPAWHLPLVNTLTLLLSGTTVTWAHHALQTGDRKGAKTGLLLTVILGILFTSIQAYEYNHIIEHKYFFSEEAANAGLYGSSFFMATGFHGFHVLIGTIFLTVCLIRLLGGGFTPNDANAFTSVPTSWTVVGTGDFNGDHRDDILWRSDTGQLSNWLGQANGGFTPKPVRTWGCSLLISKKMPFSD